MQRGIESLCLYPWKFSPVQQSLASLQWKCRNATRGTPSAWVASTKGQISLSFTNIPNCLVPEQVGRTAFLFNKYGCVVEMNMWARVSCFNKTLRLYYYNTWTVAEISQNEKLWSLTRLAAKHFLFFSA